MISILSSFNTFIKIPFLHLISSFLKVRQSNLSHLFLFYFLFQVYLNCTWSISFTKWNFFGLIHFLLLLLMCTLQILCIIRLLLHLSLCLRLIDRLFFYWLNYFLLCWSCLLCRGRWQLLLWCYFLGQ
jgi:hypothetical protein